MLPNVLVQWHIRYGNRFVWTVSDVSFNRVVCVCLHDFFVEIVLICGRMVFGRALITALMRRQCQLLFACNNRRRSKHTVRKSRTTSNHCTNHHLWHADLSSQSLSQNFWKILFYVLMCRFDENLARLGLCVHTSVLDCKLFRNLCVFRFDHDFNEVAESITQPFSVVFSLLLLFCYRWCVCVCARRCRLCKSTSCR